MKLRGYTLALAASGMLGGMAFAQEAFVNQQSPSELLGSWVMGAAVESTTGERIGSIDDVVLDLESGEISTAIISVGGFLGFGAKSIGVSWSELQINHDAREVILGMSREQMEDAPEFEERDRAMIPAPPDGGGTMDGGGGTLGGGTAPAGGITDDPAAPADDPLDEPADDPLEEPEPAPGD